MQYESRIAVWKSKPAWRVKSAREREKIFDAFAQAVRAQAERATLSEGGPFLIEKADWSLLIWVTPPPGSSGASKTVADIAEYFEPMLFVTPDGSLPLRALVEKLSGGK